MLQIISKWRVTLHWRSREDTVLWLYDNSIANVLQLLAKLQFTENGLEQPVAVRLDLEGPPATSTLSAEPGEFYATK